MLSKEVLTAFDICEWLLAEARWWAAKAIMEWEHEEGVSLNYYCDVPYPEWLHKLELQLWKESGR